MEQDKFRDIIIDFPCLFDTDYGTIAYLMYSCEDSKYFQEGYREWTKYFTKCKLVSRPNINPLSALFREEYMDQIEQLYLDLKTKYWSKICNIAEVTDILRLINMTYEYTGYTITVNCENEIEVEQIERNLPKWKTTLNNTDQTKYFCFFVYDLSKTLKNIPLLVGKSIYLDYIKPNFANFKEKVPILDSAIYLEKNIFKIISPYRDLELPYDMTPNDMEVDIHGKQYKLKQRSESDFEHSSRTSSEESSTSSTKDFR